jgi:hypothetical protein
MAVIDELAVLLTAQTKGFQQGMTSASQSVAQFSRSVITSFVGADLALRAITFAIEKTAKSASDIRDLRFEAEKLGASFEDIQKVEFLARSRGSSIDQLAVSFGRFEVKLGEATQGNKEAERAFRRLGTTSEELVNVPLPDQLEKMADGFSKIHSPALRAAAVQEVFGRSGREVIRILDLGSEGIRQFFAESEQLGLISNRSGQEMVQLSRDIAKLSLEFDIAIRKMVVGMAPALRETVSLFRQADAAIQGFLGALADLVVGQNKAAQQLNKDFDELQKRVEAFAKPIDVQAVKLSPIQDRIDGLIEKLEELDEKSNKINLARNLGGFRAQAAGVAESFDRISKAVRESQEEIRAQFEFSIRDAQDLATILIDIARKQRALEKNVGGAPGSPEEGQPINKIKADLFLLEGQRDFIEKRQKRRLAPGGAIAREREKLRDLANQAKEPVAAMARLEKEIIDFDEAVKRSTKHTEEFQTPFEKLKEEIVELNEEFQLALITQETFSRGVRKSGEEFLRAIKIFEDVPTALKGTEEGFATAEHLIRDIQRRNILAQAVSPEAIERLVGRQPLEAPPVGQGGQRVPVRVIPVDGPLEAPGAQGGQRVPRRGDFPPEWFMRGEPDPNNRQRVPRREEMVPPQARPRPDVGFLEDAGKSLREQIVLLNQAVTELRGIRQELTDQDVRALDLVPS